jgi:hypothetical protein
MLTILALLLSLPAYAQGHRSGVGGRPAADPAVEARKKQDASDLDRAYKAASERVPVAEKPDPWGGIRDAETGKNSKKKN